MENAIRRMLRGLPRNTDLATVPPERFHAFGAGIQQHRTQALGLPDASGNLCKPSAAFEFSIRFPAGAGIAGASYSGITIGISGRCRRTPIYVAMAGMSRSRTRLENWATSSSITCCNATSSWSMSALTRTPPYHHGGSHCQVGWLEVRHPLSASASVIAATFSTGPT